MIEKEIPQSWIATNLGVVCKLRNGFAFKSDRYRKEGIPVIRISDIGDGKVDLSSCVKVEQENQYQEYKVNKGDILVAMSGATTGKFGIFQTEQLAFQNQRVGRFEILDSKLLNNQFLLYLLYGLKHKILEDAYGGAQPNISSGKIEEMEIPLPPLVEQYRIVAKIEELFSELDKGIEALKTAQQQLKVYRQAVLKYAFEGRLTNPDVKEGELPEGWGFRNMKELTTKVVDGTHHTPTYVKKGVHFISVKDINDYKIDFTKTKFISQAEHDTLKNRCNPEHGDILITKSGTIGRLAIVPSIPEFSLFVSVALLKIRKDLLQSKFALYALQNHVNHLNIEKDIKGGLLKNYHLEDLRKATIMYIPFEQQNILVQEIESRLSVCDKIEESIEQGLQQAEALRQSILKKAFQGMLVPQDPNDEPASVLLERIKSDRAAAQPEKKTRTKKIKG